MSNNVNALIDKIINDAEKKVRTDLKVISSKAKQDFTEKAKEVVLLYYANYEPKLYTRTYNLQEGVINDSVSFNSLNGNGYGAWIQFSTNGMKDYIDGGDKFMVVESFMEGIHGRPSIQVDSPSPTDLMNDFQYRYKRSTLNGYFRSLGYRVNK